MSPTESQLDRARYIRTITAWHGHTQSDLGRLLGCSQVAAGRKLRGQRRFTDDELLLIADTYGVDPANMLRPPKLDDLLGPVRQSDQTLLTWPYRQQPWSAALLGGRLNCWSLAQGIASRAA